ncbi:tRNA epoxyqueuosine(34) reductase QueG [Ferriphaselus amnicola]|uniref:tRNA epoxyqueuosine(34) reductase QueG n=1 Tax=Ferriphaselus amnicola TaxID=1188319 RepID=UPI000786B6D4|nr:tRNA epoxyqueuosine(34) reductase QueG [Ferriphaselus amnicola]
MQQNSSPQDLATLAERIKAWGKELRFQAVGISGTDLSSAEAGLTDWLAQGFHGGMDYMAKHGLKRARPDELLPGTLSVISVRLDYRSAHARDGWEVLADGSRAYISRYALGRDYHKVLRNRLERLAQRIRAEVGEFGYRVFTDSAPVLEVELAKRARLGWRGKHTLLLNREHGSWFFLGEIFTDLPLPADTPEADHCGSCRRCLEICPTQAIVAPYRLDARRCISYLTIEHKGSIPLELRPLIGNRIYGCDDCQLVCPWNRFAQISQESDFAVRHGLDDVRLIELFAWDETTFQSRMAGSPIYRIGYEQWLRNIAVALGNAQTDAKVIESLSARAQHSSELVREHIHWALEQQRKHEKGLE